MAPPPNAFRDFCRPEIHPGLKGFQPTSQPLNASTPSPQADFSLDKSNLFEPAACAGLRKAIAGPEFSRDDAWQGGVVFFRKPGKVGWWKGVEKASSTSKNGRSKTAKNFVVFQAAIFHGLLLLGFREGIS